MFLRVMSSTRASCSTRAREEASAVPRWEKTGRRRNRVCAQRVEPGKGLPSPTAAGFGRSLSRTSELGRDKPPLLPPRLPAAASGHRTPPSPCAAWPRARRAWQGREQWGSSAQPSGCRRMDRPPRAAGPSPRRQ
eukprot:scaffold31478_cov101-Isochrysis_galbana.AAC.8